jgi:hypothetical protein
MACGGNLWIAESPKMLKVRLREHLQIKRLSGLIGNFVAGNNRGKFGLANSFGRLLKVVAVAE